MEWYSRNIVEPVLGFVLHHFLMFVIGYLTAGVIVAIFAERSARSAKRHQPRKGRHQ